ncbi:fibronectin type 3 domain-containing protein [Sanguibacter gelidistatuariae]|uniref:Fibronectin type 3 domain-containing protein n=1 Tax=Sanguibacter gelidistatuariae TaxID=1814289 RepID=A0A1G6UNQ5_9MICO|nr:fibronectin type III domain-containing protein [Sanguibacter gelidistatuariae]SDD42187.1 fibronectin type 3 domain-containing protein [Sanguibacter gelidistatuariae]
MDRTTPPAAHSPGTTRAGSSRAEASAQLRRSLMRTVAGVAAFSTALTGFAVIPAHAADPTTPAPTVRIFDFGTATSPVAAGADGVHETLTYTADRGFGVVPDSGVALASRDRGATQSDADRDFVIGTAWSFLVDVPNGTYDVTVTSGDTLTGTSTTKTNVSLEGVAAGTLQARQAVVSETWRAVVADGQLSVHFTGTGVGAYVNSVTLAPVPTDPGTDPTTDPTTDPPTDPTTPPDPADPLDPALKAPAWVRMAQVTADAVTVRWDQVAGATGYVLSRSDAPDGTFTEVGRTGERIFTLVDDAADTAAVSFYRVDAITATGRSPHSAVTASPLADAAALPDGGVARYDFGSGAVAPGYTALDAASAYTAETRVGFVEPGKVTATDRGAGASDPLRTDFVTIGDTELVVDLPNGDYTVSLTAGDSAGATTIAVTAEAMAKVQSTSKAAGEYLEMSFDVALVDGQLNLEIDGAAANLNALTITKKADRTAAATPTAYITGDSTVQSYTSEYMPQAGWGQMIDRFFSDGVAFKNHAIGGRSSKNFISQGRLDEVLREIKPGDYLFVQFGHNDNSYGVDDRYAGPADYENYLRTFVDGAVQRGATPIIVTPVSRRSVDATGKFTVSFPEYVDAASDLAAEQGVPLVDLSRASREYLDTLGFEAAKSVFLHVPAGVYAGRPSGTADDTHFQEYGAIQMARLIAGEIKGLDIALAGLVEEVDLPDTVPAAPASVVAGDVSNAGALIKWTAPEGADIYKVFRKDAAAGDESYTLVGTSTIAQLAVGGLAEGASYDFRVVAVNGRGDSTPSLPVRVTTSNALYKFDMQLAGNPVMPGYTEVNQNSKYTAAIGYGFLDATGLTGRDRGVGFTPPPNALQRDFLLPSPTQVFALDVPNGTYAVKTYNGDWIGSSRTNITLEGKDYGASNAGTAAVSEKMSSPVLVTDGQLNLSISGTGARLNGVEVTPLLLAPGQLALDDLTISGTDVAVALSWQGVDAATSYRVYRKAATAAAAVLVAEQDGTSLVDGGAAVGQAYTYTVTAVDVTGMESVASNPLQVTTVDPDTTVLAAPTGLTLGAVGKNDVTFTWEPADGALFYSVYRATTAGGEATYVGTSPAATYTDATVLTTVPYFYEVTAVNAGGESARSAQLESTADTVLVRQMEYLDRAPVAVSIDAGVYLGWRMLGLDPEGIAFDVFRDGTKITTTPVTASTNYVDPTGTADSVYTVRPIVAGAQSAATAEFGVWSGGSLDIPLDKPADAYTKDGQPYSYYAGDTSVADLDGDGQYEYVVMWSPNNSKDNSQAGYTGTVYIDAYTLEGTKLWRINMGQNIRAGAHYTQMMVYDFNSDGTAEVILKTADGTVDGAGTVIGDASADYRNSGGYVLTGPEFLTVFDGLTGAAIDTIAYTPPRGDVAAWGDAYGNRVDRFLAGVAYLDGEHPSAIFSRGYYTRAVIAAYDFDGTSLTQRWVFDSDVEGDQYRGQGNHNLSVADVDGDQKDEIAFGSMTIDDNGKALYTTGLGHGDAAHLSDLDPSRPGLEVFAVHEEAPSSKGIGATMRDAATGEILWSMPGTKDVGRGASGDIDPRYAGAESWAVTTDGAWNSRSGQMRAVDGTLITDTIPAANFLTWWDGDLLREITDHDFDDVTRVGVPTVSKWDWNTGTSVRLETLTGTRTNNDTKGNPAIQADLFGDWREELVYRTDDSTALRIFTTTDVTEHKLRTLMHDPVYRLGVAWQNVAYNQPPHTSFFLGEGMTTPAAPSISYVNAPVTPPTGPVPARGTLSNDNGWDTGLLDGDYTVTMNMWWGQNATSFTLFENGRAVKTVPLTDATPAAQKASVAITGKPNGTYVYTCELSNAGGTVGGPQGSCGEHTVVVRDASPATGTLSHDNWDGDGSYTVLMNMWWGSNAATYRLYENGALLDTQSLATSTPAAQHAATAVAGRAPGAYEYRAELENAAGITQTRTLTVTVR